LRLVVAEQPRFAPAWRGLGELYLAEGRWVELDGVTIALARANDSEATALKARANLAREQTSVIQ
jgi:hypothetical protein